MKSLEHLKCGKITFLFLHLLKQKGKKCFQSQITWDMGFTPQSQHRGLLFIYLGTYMHALNSCLIRMKSSFSPILREEKELFDVWWEVMLICIPLRTCWKLRWETPKSTLWIRHTWRQSVFLMWNCPWQHNDRAVCKCSITGCSDWGGFFLLELLTCALNAFWYSKWCLRELLYPPVARSAWATRSFIVYKLKDTNHIWQNLFFIILKIFEIPCGI